MPYIPKEDRERFDKLIDQLIEKLVNSNNNELSGELNYIISQICWQLSGHNNIHGERRYSRMNAIMGSLECAKMELYRRIVSTYEDGKIERNGDL